MTESRHVWLAMPCYTGTVHLGTLHAIIADILDLAAHDIRVSLREESGNAMISHSRDLFLALFLDSDATDLVFLDHDVQWGVGGIRKLLSFPVDVVAALYPRRADPLNFHVRHMQDSTELRAVDPATGMWITEPNTGLIEVEGVPMGFTRITRSCVERMVAAYPHKRFADKLAPGGFSWALFDNIHEGDVYWGEDYSFCKRWREIGGQVWVDPNIAMVHIGNKSFEGHYGEWLKSKLLGDTA